MLRVKTWCPWPCPAEWEDLGVEGEDVSGLGVCWQTPTFDEMEAQHAGCWLLVTDTRPLRPCPGITMRYRAACLNRTALDFVRMEAGCEREGGERGEMGKLSQISQHKKIIG
eukprot:1157286-Pelagomonas_calceolata.AAC.3